MAGAEYSAETGRNKFIILLQAIVVFRYLASVSTKVQTLDFVDLDLRDPPFCLTDMHTARHGLAFLGEL